MVHNSVFIQYQRDSRQYKDCAQSDVSLFIMATEPNLGVLILSEIKILLFTSESLDLFGNFSDETSGLGREGLMKS